MSSVVNAVRGLHQLNCHRGCTNRQSTASFTPAELRKLRSLKDPYGIQRYLDDMPYHLADTAWSPRRVLRENTSHCLEGAMFAAAALRANGFPPLIWDLEAEHDTDHVLALYRVKGHWGVVAKSNYTGCRFREPVYRSLRELAMSLFQSLFQPAAGAHAAHIFPSGKPGPLRSSALDDHGETGLVYRGSPVRNSLTTSCCGRAWRRRLHRIDERLFRAETLGKAKLEPLKKIHSG